MAGRSDNVAVLPGWAPRGGSWTSSSDATQLAAVQLSDLILDLERFSPELDWSPWRWKIVSTPCRMRICILRNALRQVVLSSPVNERSAMRWVLEVEAASREIERRSDEVTAQIQVLQCSGAGGARRARDLEKLLAGRSELLGALGSAQNLISQRVSPSREARAVDAYSHLVRRLRSFDENLRLMVQRYEETPRSLDQSLANVMGNEVNPEEAVVELHHMMRAAVFAEHSPLRANPNLWEAFMQQKEEFVSFCKSACNALEIYEEVLRAYSMRKCAEEGVLKHGDIEKVCKDKVVQVLERNSCIEAVRQLSEKFSAMLTVL